MTEFVMSQMTKGITAGKWGLYRAARSYGAPGTFYAGAPRDCPHLSCAAGKETGFERGKSNNAIRVGPLRNAFGRLAGAVAGTTSRDGNGRSIPGSDSPSNPEGNGQSYRVSDEESNGRSYAGRNGPSNRESNEWSNGWSNADSNSESNR
jgi:hypothetical protein